MSAPAALEAPQNPSASAGQVVRDLLNLTKPRLNLLNVCTTAGGLWLAPTHADRLTVLLTLVGTYVVIGGACALNCYLEREVDALMFRTRNRPLPAGRLAPQTALLFGLALSFIGVPLLTFAVNPLTGLLSAIALVSYVLLYTPMKRKSTLAVIVGAIPGAMPPLMGWTAATNALSVPGLVLFALLFLWQVPHFQALALFIKDDYARGGIKVTPLEKGDTATKFELIPYLFGTVAVSLLLYPMHLVGPIYFVSAGILGLVFLLWGLWGLRPAADAKWARGFFLCSVMYLTLLFTVMVIDRGGV